MSNDNKPADATVAEMETVAPAAPGIDLREPMRNLYRAYVRLLESGMDRITSLGGDCDPVDVMEANDIDLRAAREALDASPKGDHPAETPMMLAGRFYDGCWGLLPKDVQHYGRMLTQSWRTADSTELKAALEAGVLALMDSPKGGSDALARAYGYLWHVSHPEDIPTGHPYMSADRAAVEARKELRDMLTHEERGEGINCVRQKLLADMQATSAEVGA